MQYSPFGVIFTSCYGLGINLHRFNTLASALKDEAGGRLSLGIICPFQPFKARSCILDIFTGSAGLGNCDSYKKRTNGGGGLHFMLLCY